MKQEVYIHLKLPGMKRRESFLLYPYDGTNLLTLQSETRIMMLHLKTGTAVLSAAHEHGSYSFHLRLDAGAFRTNVSWEELEAIQAYLWSNSGECTDPTGILHFENKNLFASE
jgi:hypothetical protein